MEKLNEFENIDSLAEMEKIRGELEREEKEAVEETNLKKEIATFERRTEVLKGNESQAFEVQALSEKIEQDKKRLEDTYLIFLHSLGNQPLEQSTDGLI